MTSPITVSAMRVTSLSASALSAGANDVPVAAAAARGGAEPTREVERAIPKSMMIACSPSIITLAGFKSR